jgi:hypothetical protein
VVGAARFVQPLLFEVSATDGTILLAVSGLLVSIATAAALGPATAASRVDPARTLRAE